MHLKLRLFKDEVPELTTYSTSYGGQWSSDWIIIVKPTGYVESAKYIVGWSRPHVPLTDEDKRRGSVRASKPWYYTHANSAWCYSKEAENLFGVEE